MRILIVEDEKKIASFIKKGLTEKNFVVDIAETGEDGLSLMASVDYDLIVLDVMLPGKDGWSVISEVRSAGLQVPVIFLTARDGVEDRVKGLELGADDYLVKPFAFSELLARVRAVLRRPQEQKAEKLKIADLEINLMNHKVLRAGKSIELTKNEFILLSLLAQRKGEVLSRTFIAEQVWDINFDTDTNVVDVAIKRLRLKIDNPFATKLIHTVRGIGYVLEER
jgi:two-component system copper resistance phosphate regulon response regulator CusR